MWLAPTDLRSLITRVLANLVNTYVAHGDDPRLLRVLSDQLAIHPRVGALRARRGEVRERMGDVDGALDDFNLALATLPPESGYGQIHERARKLARLRESEN